MPIHRIRAVLVLVLWIGLAALQAAAGIARADIRSAEAVVMLWAGAGAHPLTGRIWRASDGKSFDGLALARGIQTGTPFSDAMGIRGKRYILLGEVHDNREHHALRAGFVHYLTEPTAYGRSIHPAVVSEHIASDKAVLLTTFRETGGQARDLFRALDWGRSGWPDERMFEPLYTIVLDGRLPLRAGNPARDLVRSVARGGFDAIDRQEVARLGLDKPLPEDLGAALAAELKGSHCGMLPDAAVPGMAAAQQYRDAFMADALISAEVTAGRAILLAGNGHVRADRGAPWHLRKRTPGASIAAVLLIEVQDGKADMKDYIPRDPAGRPAADVVVLTPRASRDDPCEKMRANLRKKG